jgi:hypothetical protein
VGLRRAPRGLGSGCISEKLPTPLRQRFDENLSIGMKNLRTGAEIGQKRDQTRILAALIIGEDFD